MPIQSKDGGYPVTWSVPEQGFSRKFSTSDELRQFLEQEREFWSELQNVNGWSNGAKGDLPSQISTIARPFREAASISSGPVDQLTHLESNGVLISAGKVGRAIEIVRQHDPKLVPGVVLMALAAHPGMSSKAMAVHNHPATNAQLIATLGALQHLTPQEEASKSAEKANEALADAQRLASEIDTVLTESTATSRAQLLSLQTDIDAFLAERKLLLSKAQSTLDQALDEYEKKITQLQDKTLVRLALEAPTTYWVTKADSHRTAVVWASIVFIVVLGFGVWWLTHHGIELVATAQKEIVGNAATAGLANLIPLAFITLPSLAIAWVLRHVSRVIVQNLALGADARLRGTIATTYRALTTDREASQAELAIALHALFRPVDGADHGEIAPPNLQEIMEMATPKGR